MDADRTQPTLIARLRNVHDVVAWSEFDEKYRELILRYCRARGLQHSDCEDVRQIVMLELARTLPDFRYSAERGKFRNYLGRVVLHVITRHVWRRPRGGDSTPDDANLIADATELDAQWEQEWIDHHYRLAMSTIQSMHDSRTLAVFERLAAGDSVADVARRFALSEPAVHKVKQRIRDELKERIAAQIRDEDEPERHSEG
jgi:RNA polymerase sigma factor (sigma-70 family)